MSLGSQIARFAWNRTVLLAVLPVFGASMRAYLAAPSPLWFFVAIPLMGVCFGLTDLFMNAEAVALYWRPTLDPGFRWVDGSPITQDPRWSISASSGGFV